MDRTGITAVLVAAALAGGAFLMGMRVGADDEFQPVVDAARDVRARATRPVTTEALVRGAVRGMLDVLEDPYAAFLGPTEAAAALEETSGTFVGVGVWLEPVPEGLRVASVLEGSPARDAGVAPGDVVVAIDHRSAASMSVTEAGALLRGAEGSTVTLSLTGADGRRDVTLARARIPLGQVQARMLEEGVGYLRPASFARGVAGRLGQELRRLAEQGARSVVLDLRGNPGGLTEEAVGVAQAFLGDEVVAVVRGGDGERELRGAGDAVSALPAAVLVDGGTASAAEMVAGALRDHGRATLVGTPTFGKGALLGVSDVEGTGGSVRFTTGTFVTPDGHEVEGSGLIPEVAVLPGGPIDAQLDRAVRLLLGEEAA